MNIFSQHCTILRVLALKQFNMVTESMHQEGIYKHMKEDEGTKICARTCLINRAIIP